MEIDDKLYQDIEEYCKLNNITDIKNEINKMLIKGFNIEKYGYSPFQINQDNEQPIKEIKKEKKIEKPKKVLSSIKDNKQETEEKKEIVKTEEKPKKRKVRIIKND